jgi:hypothetical protein
MTRRDYSKEEMFTEPDPSSDNESPEFMDEVFQMYQATNTKPETIRDPKERAQYESWLARNPEGAE